MSNVSRALSLLAADLARSRSGTSSPTRWRRSSPSSGDEPTALVSSWLWLTSVAALLALAVRLRADQIRLDLRDAARSLIRNKTFTLTAIATLALALGPATAVFSVINGVVLDPIPGVNTDRLTYVWSANPERDRHEFPWSELNFSGSPRTPARASRH